MRLPLHSDVGRLQTYLPRFVAMIGVKAWDKRATALLQQARGTAFQSYVVERYHWLELELAYLRRWRQKAGGLSPRMESAASTSALRFAAFCVEIDARLNPRGRAELRGRLRDALKSDGGFAPLYIEVLHAAALSSHGFEIDLPDLEKSARYDVEGERNGTVFTSECKHISADAGRRIHQKDFYRLIQELFDTLVPPASARAAPSIILITLDDRLPSADASRRAIVGAVRHIVNEPLETRIRGAFFEVAKLSYAANFGFDPITDRTIFRERAQELFGANCHAVTTADQYAGLTIVMRSLVEDDHTKPQLEALKAAARQLPIDKTAFVAVQFDDLDFSELLYPHVAERLQMVANYFFATRDSAHIGAVVFSAYRPSRRIDPVHEWNPLVVCWNPAFNEEFKTGLPFQSEIDMQIARSISDTTRSRRATRAEVNRSPSSASYRRRAVRRRRQRGQLARRPS